MDGYLPTTRSSLFQQDWETKSNSLLLIVAVIPTLALHKVNAIASMPNS